MRSLDMPSKVRQNVSMRVISLKLLRDFWRRFPDAERPLRQWYKTTIEAQWNSLHDARKTYPHADGDDTFDLQGIVSRKKQLIPYLASLLQTARAEGALPPGTAAVTS